VSLRVCNVDGCPELVEGGGKCDRHRKAARRRSDRGRPPSSQRGYGAEWRRVRAEALPPDVELLCEDESRCSARATEVHHRDGNPDNNDPGNHQRLCKPHHSRKTARERPGGFGR
jgi:5-methylcytosine-specific restriction protein A